MKINRIVLKKYVKKKILHSNFEHFEKEKKGRKKKKERKSRIKKGKNTQQSIE